MSEEMREEFEAWARNEQFVDSGRDALGRYRSQEVDDMWYAWKASRESLEAECAALAAGACDGVIGDDYGNAFCQYKQLLSEARQWVAFACDQGFGGAEDLGYRIDSALEIKP